VVHGVDHFSPGFWDAFVWHVNDVATRATTPVSISSWYRSPAANDAAGGVRDSQHLLGAAVDIVGLSRRDLASDFTRRGFVVVNESDHLHVQAWPAGLARSAGLMDYLGL